MDWKDHWQQYPEGFDETEFLAQVGKTVNRAPISPEQFSMIVRSVVDALKIDAGDTVLDLCCGNGLITHAISSHCKAISGIDYSAPLIEVARRHKAGPNITYYSGSVLDIDALPPLVSFKKAYMYEALQHFRRDELRPILSTIFSPGSSVQALLLASVPDRSRRWRFYNTPQRKLDWLIRTLKGAEAIGTWWGRRDIIDACSRLGLSAEFMEQPGGLYTAHYRMNVLIQRST